MQRFEAIEKPEDGWSLYDNNAPAADPREESGAEIGIFTEERTARLVAVLMNAREAAPEEKPTPTRIQRQARGAWGGSDSPKAGRIYSLSGLVGGGVAEDVTDKAIGRPFTATEPRQDDDDEPEVSRTPCGGGTVTAWPSGWTYVKFSAKPADHILEDLRTAGARWMGARKGWRIQDEALPDGYDRARQVQA